MIDRDLALCTAPTDFYPAESSQVYEMALDECRCVECGREVAWDLDDDGLPEPRRDVCGVWCEAIQAAQAKGEFILASMLREHLAAQRRGDDAMCVMIDAVVEGMCGMVTPEW